MTAYQAAQGVLTSGNGYFSVELTMAPSYAHDGVASIHTLLVFGDACRFYFDGTAETFRLEVDGETLETAAVEFDADDEITLRVEHTADRRRIRVKDAISGNGVTDGEPLPPTSIESLVSVMGPANLAAEEFAELVALRPTDAETFAELVKRRILSQYDREGALRTFIQGICAKDARTFDIALFLRDALDVKSATEHRLDLIGSIVHLPRHGFSDARYRTFLEIQIELLLSASRDGAEWTGTAPNLIRITRTFLGETSDPIRYVSTPPYSYTMSVVDLDYSEVFLLARFLARAQYAGVSGLLLIELGDEASLMGSDSVVITGAGTMGSDTVTVPGAMIMGTVVETQEAA